MTYRTPTLCPYCAEVDHYKAALDERPGRQIDVVLSMYQKNWKPEANSSPTKRRKVKAVEHGRYWLVTLTEKDHLASTFKGLKVEVIGMEYKFNGSPLFYPVFGPLLGPVFTPYDQATGEPIGLTFDACRVTCEGSPLDIRIHWHGVGRREISSNEFLFNSEENLKKFQLALSLFRDEDKRGRRNRFNLWSVVKTIQELQREEKPQISIELIAARMDHSATGLRKWMEVESESLESLCDWAHRLTEAKRLLDSVEAKQGN